jgi:hypothetical protein
MLADQAAGGSRNKIRTSLIVLIACAVSLLCLFWTVESHAKQLTSIQGRIRSLNTCCPAEDFKDFVGNEAAVKAVQAMFTSVPDQPQWPKAVLALGQVEPVNLTNVQILWRFLIFDGSFANSAGPRSEKAPGEHEYHRGPLVAIPDDLARAKSEVPLALAEMLQRKPYGSSTDTDVRGYLIGHLKLGTNPGFWTDHIMWSGESLFGSDRLRDVTVAARCVKALGLSKESSALAFILALSKQPPADDVIYQDAIKSALCHLAACKQN